MAIRMLNRRGAVWKRVNYLHSTFFYSQKSSTLVWLGLRKVYCKQDTVRQCLQYKSVNTETSSGEKIMYVDFMVLLWCYTEAGT